MSGDLNQSFKGKIAVVTGSTQGLGEAVARLFADRGLSGLVICGRNQSKGKEVADSIHQSGCPTYYVQADLAQVEHCRNIIQKADEEFGRINCLVNCAAITDRGTVLDTSPKFFFFQAEDGIRAPEMSRGLGDVYKRQICCCSFSPNRSSVWSYFCLLHIERKTNYQTVSYTHLTLPTKRIV